jgi:uncharacterized membrane protein
MERTLLGRRILMSDLVAVAYPDLGTARAVMDQLRQAQTEHLIELEDAVIVERREEGKVKLHQSQSTVGSGATGGALFGGLIGLIFLAPLLGMAMGAAAGGAMGAATDVGVNDNFMKELGVKLEPGAAAVFVLVRRMTADKLLERIEHRGEVLTTSLSTDAEEQLRDALEKAGAAQA